MALALALAVLGCSGYSALEKPKFLRADVKRSLSWRCQGGMAFALNEPPQGTPCPAEEFPEVAGAIVGGARPERSKVSGLKSSFLGKSNTVICGTHCHGGA